MSDLDKKTDEDMTKKDMPNTDIPDKDVPGTGTAPVDQEYEISEMHSKMRKRNMVFGAAMGVFVIILMIVSYFRIKGLTP